MKKNNVRKCLLTRMAKHKSNLIRFVVINHKGIIDLENEIKARGYYLSYDIDQELLSKKKSIIHKLNNNDKFLEQLKELIQRSKHEKTGL